MPDLDNQVMQYFGKRQMLEQLPDKTATIMGLTPEEADNYIALVLADNARLPVPFAMMRAFEQKILEAADRENFILDEGPSPFPVRL